MSIILCLIITPLLITSFRLYFSNYYKFVVDSFIQQGKNLETTQEGIKNNPIIALFLISLVFGYCLLSKSTLILTAFMILFAIAAYIDALCRWVPDVLIYSMVWISAFGLNQSFQDSLVSAVLFCIPAALLYLITYIKDRKGSFASGDCYLFPVIGIWIQPEYAALVMMIGIGVALISSRFMKDVPFLTCVFPVFIGEQLCEIISFH